MAAEHLQLVGYHIQQDCAAVPAKFGSAEGKAGNPQVAALFREEQFGCQAVSAAASVPVEIEAETPSLTWTETDHATIRHAADLLRSLQIGLLSAKRTYQVVVHQCLLEGAFATLRLAFWAVKLVSDVVSWGLLPDDLILMLLPLRVSF